jgi:UDP-glucuronate 4-epimerase
MNVIVTGSCGFIGSHLCEKLLNNNFNVIGIDNFNSDIYDSKHKYNNLKILEKYENYFNVSDDILNDNYILKYDPDIVIHLAGYANVRKSSIFPEKFIKNNILVTTKILNEISQTKKKPLFIYASSSSVYGENKKIPFNEVDNLDNIVSVYALSKKMCEDMVNLYCKTYNLKAIGLRFFSVYGPRGRPDMAPYIFLSNIMNEKFFDLYGDGTIQRDFTYIDDITDGIYNCIKLNMTDGIHKIYNLGNNSPITINNFINICENISNKKALINKKLSLKEDVNITYADITNAKNDLFYNPKISIEEGLKRTYNWMLHNNIDS